MLLNFRKIILFTALFLLNKSSNAQVDTLREIIDTVITAGTLQHVRVTAFEHNRSLKDVPAAVNYIGRSNLEKFGPASLVQAVNATAGVRMEERSPGSYRFNIRGSSLRSPFGVRNVKVYFNDIPFTDPGGNTYLNQLGYYNFNSIEIVKGPGSSLYGSGTGGVLLIESLSPFERPAIAAEYSTGSYGLHNIYGSITTGNEKFISRVGFQHQQADGYRDQSALKRNVHSWSGLFRFDEKHILKTSFLYGDHFYETPGALTKAEYDTNPKGARPGGGGFPGAVAAKASIRQKTFLAGASFDQELFPWLKNKSVLYGMFTQLINPNLRGYEKSSLPHVGGRTTFKFEKDLGAAHLNFDIGGEWQQGFNAVSVHKNVAGNADSLRTTDEIDNRQSLLFAQALLDVYDGWTIVAGASVNWYKISFARYTPATLGKQTRRISNELAPRLALMKKFNRISIYSSVSKGFSPPTVSELLPTGGAINLGLNAEDGINYDIGFKASFDNRFTIDLNAFYFRLNNTIVQRRDAGGGDFFINAGKTAQKGIEVAMSHPLISKPVGIIENSLAWLSYTYHHFRYKEFKPLTSDFSGNRLPGVPPHTVAAGYDLFFKKGIMTSVNYYFSDRLPLNDANSVYANAYHLLGAKIGYYLPAKNRWRLKLAAGADNLLDEKYSLGNDVNGFGGRYFNAAPGRNYYVSVMVGWLGKREM